jgi:hypothetical protein
LQFHWLTVDPHIRNPSSRRYNSLANIESRRNAYRLNGYVNASALRQIHDVLSGVPLTAVDYGICPKLFCDHQAFVIQIPCALAWPVIDQRFHGYACACGCDSFGRLL